MIKFLPYPTLLATLIFLILPAVSFAHTPNLFQSGYWGGPETQGGRGGLVSCTAPVEVSGCVGGGGAPAGVPCTSLCDLIHTIVHIIVFGMSLTIFGATPILFAWGGILILISSGNAGKISDGKKILTGTLIGLLIILSAYLIVKTFVVTLGLTGYIPGFGNAFTCVQK